jgi:hypothetical protein
MMVALVIHTPALWILLTLHRFGVAFWPTLFVVGYGEWVLLIAAIMWGCRSLTSVSQQLRSSSY